MQGQHSAGVGACGAVGSRGINLGTSPAPAKLRAEWMKVQKVP